MITFQILFLSATRFPFCPDEFLTSFLLLQFLEDFQSSKSCMISFEMIFQNFCFKEFINFELSSHILFKFEETDYLLENQKSFIFVLNLPETMKNY